MRTVVVGNRKLARQLLRHTLAEGWQVVGAVVPAGRLASDQANFAPFDDLVDGTDCALHRTSDINGAETRAWLRDRDPDVCLCGGWSQIIDETTLDVPDRGFLGFHSSRLPEGRGGAPVNWSLIDGADEVWISLFYYVPGVDAGDVLAREAVPVEPRDDVATVFERLAVAACRLLSAVRADLAAGDVDAEPQSLAAATYRPRRQPQDGLVDWRRDPGEQFDWVRAQTSPYPGAYTFHDGRQLTIWRSTPVEGGATGDPGEVLGVETGAGVDVRTGDGVLRLERVQVGDRPPRWADEWAADAGVTGGEVLGRHHAPVEWLYTGIRGPADPTNFETNLRAGETGAVDVVAHSGTRRELAVSVSLDGTTLFEESAPVAPDYCRRVEYAPTEPGTHTLAVGFRRDGEAADTRYLKVFVHE